jgi:hypothetical protein
MWRRLAAALCMAALLSSVAPVASYAEDGQSIPPAAIEKSEGPGCPNAEVGRPCCGSASCREAKAAAAAEGKTGGCPCQRAKAARAAQAAKEAAEARQ